MSDNYKDQDIEKLIFGGALASGSIEPSEGFWNKAYEDILQREGSLSRKRVLRWKTGFYAMAAIALLMVWYGVSMRNEVNDIKQQVNTLSSSSTIMNQNITLKEAAKTIENSSSATKNTSTKEEISHITVTNSKSPLKPENNLVTSYNKRTWLATQKQNSKANLTIITNSGLSQTENSNIAVTKENNDGNKTISIPGNNSQQAPASNALPTNSPSTPTASIQNDNTPVINKKLDSATANSVVDTVNSTFTVKKPVTLAGILSKISVSAFYAPGITDDFLSTKNNDPTNAITADELKTHQDGDGTMAIGLRVSYDISDKWTIQTGCYYSKYSYNINPTVIYAQQQENGQVGYAINTSSGTDFIPNSSVPAHLGDSIQVRGNSSRGYISIPLQVKYKFWAGTRLSFYVDAGFSVNMANYEQTSLHWENTAFQEGDVSINDIYGLNSIQYSYNLGFGAAYLVRRGLSVYTEPFVNGAVTSINKNTPVIIYPYFFGWSFGLTYHF
jgi:hypothetical protein